MTKQYEIERLLKMTGRTLECIQKKHSIKELADAARRPETSLEVICQQSDVIELLIGALKDVLDKPMQKPLTLEQLSEYEDKPVFVEYGFRKPNWTQLKIETAKWLLLRWFGKGAEEYRPYIDFVTTCIPDNDGCYTLDFRRREYGKTWRAWAARPTDEERAAAKWEV